MKPVTDEGFIEIGGQVAMPEETVAELLGVSIERLHELTRDIDEWNREGGIYARDDKQYFASPQVIFKVRDANGKKSADLSTRKLFQVFAKAEQRLTPAEYKKKNRRTMLKIGAFVFAGCLCAVFVACFCAVFFHDDKPKPTTSPPPKTETVRQPAPQPPKVDFSHWNNFPEQISTLPSIGSTRKDFESMYRQTATNGVGYARYSQDVWHAQFLDPKGNATDDKSGRAAMVTVQVVAGVPFTDIDLNNLLPSDAVELTYDEIGSDNMIAVKNVKGTSAQLANIFPKSGGNFSAGFNWDKMTGEFIGGTVMVAYPLPSKK